jgi:hypothetical protein
MKLVKKKTFKESSNHNRPFTVTPILKERVKLIFVLLGVFLAVSLFFYHSASTNDSSINKADQNELVANLDTSREDAIELEGKEFQPIKQIPTTPISPTHSGPIERGLDLSGAMDPIGLKLILTPESAEPVIWIDGLLHTPRKKDQFFIKDISPGEKELVIQAKGFQTYSSLLFIRDGLNKLQVNLMKKRGELLIKSLPFAFVQAIRADDRVVDLGETDRNGQLLVRDILVEGRYKIKVSKPNYQTYHKESIQVNSGARTSIDAILSPMPATLLVTSEPEKGQIFLENQLLGKTPLTLNNLETDKKLLFTIRLSGYQEKVQSVFLRPGESFEMNFGSLEKEKLYFTLGSHKDQVAKSMGTPSRITRYNYPKTQTWYYGSSRVEFSTKDYQVTQWSNLDKNLKVRINPGPNVTQLSYFSIGSHMDDVIRLQGTPTSITKYDALKTQTWSYGSSRVELSTKDDRVIEWSNLDKNLKVRL